MVRGRPKKIIDNVVIDVTSQLVDTVIVEGSESVSIGGLDVDSIALALGAAIVEYDGENLTMRKGEKLTCVVVIGLDCDAILHRFRLCGF